MRHVCPWPAILIPFRSEWCPHPHPFFVLSSAIARSSSTCPSRVSRKGCSRPRPHNVHHQTASSISDALRLPECGLCLDCRSRPRELSAIHHGDIVRAPSSAHARDDFVMSKLIWSRLRIVCHCDPQRVCRPSRSPPWNQHCRKPRSRYSIYPLSSPMPSLSPRYKAG